jgi:hypothetical protein
MLLPPKEAINFHIRLSHQLRRNALQKLTIAALEVPATLFRSDDGDKPWSGPHDYGWTALCGQLAVINVEGSHTTLFEPRHCELLRERLLEAVGVVLPPSWSRAANADGKSAKVEKVGLDARDPAETRRELAARVLEAQDRLAKNERDELQHALNYALYQLADLKRSRLLKVGRLLRRIAGLPIPY